jgi:hypothetical protein
MIIEEKFSVFILNKKLSKTYIVLNPFISYHTLRAKTSFFYHLGVKIFKLQKYY